MMDAEKYLKERGRMSNGCNTYSCKDCKLGLCYNRHELTCTELEHRYPEEAVAIVENWAKEHPAKTYKSVFLERFPDAKVEHGGTPCPCIIYIFGEKAKPINCGTCGCVYCWNREAKETYD